MYITYNSFCAEHSMNKATNLTIKSERCPRSQARFQGLVSLNNKARYVRMETFKQQKATTKTKYTFDSLQNYL